MPFNRDQHIIFEKYLTLTEKVSLDGILNLLQNKNEKIASKLLEMDKTTSKGHVLKLAKFFNEIQNLDVLSEYYKKFLELKKRNLIQDITGFKSFNEMENAIDAMETKVNLSMPEEVGDAEKPLYEDENIKVFEGGNRAKCVKLGSNYSFCISRTGGGNLYSSYRLRDQSSFYFVRLKKRTDEKKNGEYVDPAHLMVIDALPRGEYNWTWADNGSQGHGTTRVTKEQAIKEFPELKPAFDKIITAKPLTRDEKSKIEKFNELASDFDVKIFNSLKYSEKEEFIQQGGVELAFDVWKTLDKNLRNEYLKNIENFDREIFEDLKPNEIVVFEKQIQKSAEAEFNYFLYLDKLIEKDER